MIAKKNKKEYTDSIEKQKANLMNTDTQQVEININAQVKVLLTDYGQEIFIKHYEQLKSLQYMPNEKEELTLSLWEISNIFGSVLYMGNTKVPFVGNQFKMDFKLNPDQTIKTCM